MSDPRMIPADEAKQLREGITPGTWRLNEWESVAGLTIEYWDESTMEVANVKLAEAAPDLAHTVVEQAETIQTLSRLLAGAEEAATERAAQIERLQAALREADSEHARDHGHDNPDWHETTADALDYAVDLLTEAPEGDTQ